ncbi:MAG: carboxyltransferase domain-containing protein [Desulfomicrobium escambiense]|nr:carboxyltransferase domain-containing protein [Desulfomicrobium escambiense]
MPIIYDPLETGYPDLESLVRSRIEKDFSAPRTRRRIVGIPVSYVAAPRPGPPGRGPPRGTVPRRRSSPSTPAGAYLVYMLGFTPGFPYLGGLDERIAAPRRGHPPGPESPSGSVGIADRQTGHLPPGQPRGLEPSSAGPPRSSSIPAPTAPGPPGRRAVHPVHRRSPPGEYEDLAAAAASGRWRPEITEEEQSATGDDRPRARPPHHGPGPGPLRQPVPGAFRSAGAADPDALETANLLVGNDPRRGLPGMHPEGAGVRACRPGGLRGLRGGHGGCASTESLPRGGRPCTPRPGTWSRSDSAAAGLRVLHRLRGRSGGSLSCWAADRPTPARTRRDGRAGPSAPATGSSLRAGPPAGGIPRRAVPEDLRPAYPDDPCAPSLPTRPVGSNRIPSNGSSGKPYTVSPQSDRMGCRPDGEPLVHTRGADIVSSGVQTGTVQVPGNGLPIVLSSGPPDHRRLYPDRPRGPGGPPPPGSGPSRPAAASGSCALRSRKLRPPGGTASGTRRSDPVPGYPEPCPPAHSVPEAQGLRFRVTVGGRTYDVEIIETWTLSVRANS